MKKTMKLALGLAFGIFLVGAMPTLAAAQEDISQKQIPSLELDQADVREALRALFKNVNVSYSIAPEVQGTVTVSLKNVTFDLALQNVLRQVDATYRVEGGVYEIVRKAHLTAPTPGAAEEVTPVKTTIVRRIKIRSADPQFIAMMLGRKGGNQNYNIAPEMSTITGGMSMGGGMGWYGYGRHGYGNGSTVRRKQRR